MTNCTTGKLQFSKLGRWELEADFSGGAASSNVGLLLLREVNRHLKLTERLAAVLDDPRGAGMAKRERPVAAPESVIDDCRIPDPFPE